MHHTHLLRGLQAYKTAPHGPRISLRGPAFSFTDFLGLFASPEKARFPGLKLIYGDLGGRASLLSALDVRTLKRCVERTDITALHGPETWQSALFGLSWELRYRTLRAKLEQDTRTLLSILSRNDMRTLASLAITRMPVVPNLILAHSFSLQVLEDMGWINLRTVGANHHLVQVEIPLILQHAWAGVLDDPLLSYLTLFPMSPMAGSPFETTCLSLHSLRCQLIRDLNQRHGAVDRPIDLQELFPGSRVGSDAASLRLSLCNMTIRTEATHWVHHRDSKVSSKPSAVFHGDDVLDLPNGQHTILCAPANRLADGRCFHHTHATPAAVPRPLLMVFQMRYGKRPLPAKEVHAFRDGMRDALAADPHRDGACYVFMTNRPDWTRGHEAAEVPRDVVLVSKSSVAQYFGGLSHRFEEM